MGYHSVMLPQDVNVPELAQCSTLYDIADHLLVNVFAALQGSYTSSPNPVDTLLAYVTMGRGDDAIADSLSVNIRDVSPSPGTQAGGRTIMLGLYRASFEVRLIETGWPMAEVVNGVVYVPDPVRQNALARHAFSHGEVMYRKLIYMVGSRNITPTSVPGCSNASIGSLTPVTPLGGTIGFVVPLVIDVPWGGG